MLCNRSQVQDICDTIRHIHVLDSRLFEALPNVT